MWWEAKIEMSGNNGVGAFHIKLPAEEILTSLSCAISCVRTVPLTEGVVPMACPVYKQQA